MPINIWSSVSVGAISFEILRGWNGNENNTNVAGAQKKNMGRADP